MKRAVKLDENMNPLPPPGEEVNPPQPASRGGGFSMAASDRPGAFILPPVNPNYEPPDGKRTDPP